MQVSVPYGVAQGSRFIGTNPALVKTSPALVKVFVYMLNFRYPLLRNDLSHFGSLRSPPRVLPTETQAESGKTQSKGGISLVRNSGNVDAGRGPVRSGAALALPALEEPHAPVGV